MGLIQKPNVQSQAQIASFVAWKSAHMASEKLEKELALCILGTGVDKNAPRPDLAKLQKLRILEHQAFRTYMSETGIAAINCRAS